MGGWKGGSVRKQMNAADTGAAARLRSTLLMEGDVGEQATNTEILRERERRETDRKRARARG